VARLQGLRENTMMMKSMMMIKDIYIEVDQGDQDDQDSFVKTCDRASSANSLTR
jgi:hypothetical protein